MTISQMLSQSGLLTLLGMAVVFGFIIIMIFCMKLLQLFVHAAKLDKDEKPNTQPVNSSVKTDDTAIIAAIAAAVHDKELNS